MKRLLLSLAVLLTIGSTSCKKTPAHQDHHYQRVVVLGNSILRHEALPAIGWTHNWGMAASSPSNDFYHILVERLKKETPGVQVKSQNIVPFELRYWKYDAARFDTIKQFNPDLLIVRIGENVKGDSVTQHEYAKHFGELLDHTTTKDTHVLVAGSINGGNPATAIMEQVCKARNIDFIPLSQVGDDPANRATGQFTDVNVASHPDDDGMKAIADAIWNNI